MLITNNFSTLLTTEPNKKIPMNEYVIQYILNISLLIINHHIQRHEINQQ